MSARKKKDWNKQKKKDSKIGRKKPRKNERIKAEEERKKERFQNKNEEGNMVERDERNRGRHKKKQRKVK